jgi:hypothetical protein
MAIKAVVFDAWGLVLKSNLASSFLQFEKAKGLPANFLRELGGKSGSSINLLYAGKIQVPEAHSRLEKEIISKGFKLSQDLDFTNFLNDFRSQIRVNGDVRDALQCE